MACEPIRTDVVFCCLAQYMPSTSNQQVAMKIGCSPRVKNVQGNVKKEIMKCFVIIDPTNKVGTRFGDDDDIIKIAFNLTVDVQLHCMPSQKGAMMGLGSAICKKIHKIFAPNLPLSQWQTPLSSQKQLKINSYRNHDGKGLRFVPVEVSIYYKKKKKKFFCFITELETGSVIGSWSGQILNQLKFLIHA